MRILVGFLMNWKIFVFVLWWWIFLGWLFYVLWKWFVWVVGDCYEMSFYFFCWSFVIFVREMGEREMCFGVIYYWDEECCLWNFICDFFWSNVWICCFWYCCWFLSCLGICGCWIFVLRRSCFFWRIFCCCLEILRVWSLLIVCGGWFCFDYFVSLFLESCFLG